MTAFESIGDDDPEDHAIRFAADTFPENSFDPDWMDHDYFAIQPWLPDDDVLWVAPGRNMVVRREDVYG